MHHSHGRFLRDWRGVHFLIGAVVPRVLPVADIRFLLFGIHWVLFLGSWGLLASSLDAFELAWHIALTEDVFWLLWGHSLVASSDTVL